MLLGFKPKEQSASVRKDPNSWGGGEGVGVGWGGRLVVGGGVGARAVINQHTDKWLFLGGDQEVSISNRGAVWWCSKFSV